jgi:type I restriction enzyme S subunit
MPALRAVATGSTYEAVTADDIRCLQVPNVPVALQRVIGDYLDTETARIDALVAKRRRMVELLERRWVAEVRSGLNAMASSTVALHHVARVKRGQSPRPIDDPSYFDESGSHGWVRIEDATRAGVYLTATKQRLSPLGRSRSVSVGPGILLVSIAASVGKPIITAMECCYHDGWVGLLDLQAVPEFVFLCLMLPETFGGLGQIGTQANINSEIVGRVRIPRVSMQT